MKPLPAGPSLPFLCLSVCPLASPTPGVAEGRTADFQRWVRPMAVGEDFLQRPAAFQSGLCVLATAGVLGCLQGASCLVHADAVGYCPLLEPETAAWSGRGQACPAS